MARRPQATLSVTLAGSGVTEPEQRADRHTAGIRTGGAGDGGGRGLVARDVAAQLCQHEGLPGSTLGGHGMVLAPVGPLPG